MRLFLEPYCINCGSELDYRNIINNICSKCIPSIPRISIQNSCMKCGLPDSINSCYFCQHHKLKVKRNISIFTYEGIVRELIYDIKFNNQRDRISILKCTLSDIMLDEIFEDRIDVMIPIPASLKSILKRGFDFVKLAFKSVARINRKPLLNVLGRKPFHKEQKKLSKEDREKLVTDQFYIRRRADLSGRNVLLVDDVLTTGSTINACADLVMSLCPGTIYSLTLVRVLEE